MNDGPDINIRLIAHNIPFFHFIFILRECTLCEKRTRINHILYYILLTSTDVILTINAILHEHPH